MIYFILFLQLYVQIGNTRQVTTYTPPNPPPTVCPNCIVVIPGIIAEPDLTKGQAEYDMCMAQPNPPSVFCTANRQTAIATDAQNRVKNFILEIYGGDGIATNINIDQLLANYKLYIIK